MNDDDSSRLIVPDEWKLWLFAAMLAVAGLGLFLPDWIGHALGFVSVLVQLGAMTLAFSAVVWVFYAIRCRHCGLRLVMYAMSKKGVGEWLQWLLTVKRCPQCGLTNGDDRKSMGDPIDLNNKQPPHKSDNT